MTKIPCDIGIKRKVYIKPLQQKRKLFNTGYANVTKVFVIYLWNAILVYNY
jgi:hypothetical protein